MRHLSFTLLLLLLSFASFAQVAPITGSLNACPGGISALTDATSGGTWSSSNPAIVTVSSTTGMATAVATGLATISYTVGSSYATAVFTVLATPAPITGTPTVCPGFTTTLVSTTPGGSWVSATPAVATVSSGGGVVTGISAGTTWIYYTVGSCSSVINVTVNTAPAAITGPWSVCTGSSVTLVDATGGGTWSASTPSVGSIDPLTGVITGVTAGMDTITYSLSTGCYAYHIMSVNAAPSVSASATLSCGGSYTLTASGAATYTWSPATGLSCTACSSPTVYPTGSVAYSVTGAAVTGCTGITSVLANGNRITGHISPSGTGSVRVWLVKYNPLDSSIVATDSMMTCTDGGSEYYEFTTPASGTYRVKAYLLGGTPGGSGYIPTYGGSYANWYNADTLAHASATDTMDISLIYGTVPSGPGFISGYVYSGAGKGTTGELPAPGMLVYLKDGAGNVLTYTYTDAAGVYSFTGLAYGTYQVYPEAYKYYTTPSAMLTLSSSVTSISGITFKQRTSYGTIIPWAPTSVPSVTGAAMVVYPDPAGSELYISDVKTAGTYSITDITGRRMMSGTLQQGLNTCNVSTLPAGVYILEVNAGGRSTTRIVKD